MSEGAEEILAAVAQWLASASRMGSSDYRLIIEKRAFMREGDAPTKVQFRVQAEVFALTTWLPVYQTPQPLIQPASADQLPTPKDHA